MKKKKQKWPKMPTVYTNLFVTATSVGDEGADTANAIAGMYQDWCLLHGLKFSVSDGISAKTKTVEIKIRIRGDVSKILKGEEGAHRICRISPYDPQRRRHTTWVEVGLEKRKSDALSSTIRSYVLAPYNLIKDLRTGVELRDEAVEAAFYDGEIDRLLLHDFAGLPKIKTKTNG